MYPRKTKRQLLLNIYQFMLLRIHFHTEIGKLGTLFFLKVFGGHMSFFWGHWYPCFGFLVTSPLGFKARVGSALFAIFLWRRM